MTSLSQKSVCRLGVLLSGRGSNFAAIQRAIEEGRLQGAEIAVVVSNRPDAQGLEVAREKALTVVALTEAQAAKRVVRDEVITEALQAHQVDWVILAGYDRIIGQPLLSCYEGRVLNMHPSLLPAYGGKNMVGLNVHRAVLEAGERESGCTVHLVTDVVDGGAILGQARVPVLPSDTPETLAARVLEQEHQLYATVIQSCITPYFLEKGSVDAHEHAS